MIRVMLQGVAGGQDASTKAHLLAVLLNRLSITLSLPWTPARKQRTEAVLPLAQGMRQSLPLYDVKISLMNDVCLSRHVVCRACHSLIWIGLQFRRLILWFLRTFKVRILHFSCAVRDSRSVRLFGHTGISIYASAMPAHALFYPYLPLIVYLHSA